MSNIIELVDLTKKYGSFAAVDHLNLSVRKGEVFGLLGPNGAGKSTTILMMLGLTEPTSGSATVCGINPAINPLEVKRKVGYLPEDVGFYPDLTGFENLMYIARLNRIPYNLAKERSEQLLDRVGLAAEVKKKTGKYSRGMRQRLGLADALIKNPEVIILDEPTLGIDPLGVKEFLELIVRLSREDEITVLFSSHHLHQVQEVCDRVGLFVGGRLIADGDIKSLSAKIFGNEPFVVQASAVSAGNGDNEGQPSLKEQILSIDGVIGVEVIDGIFRIACSRDVTSDIAGAIVRSGAALNYLQKKEYALDDIYHRYFEGGEPS